MPRKMTGIRPKLVGEDKFRGRDWEPEACDRWALCGLSFPYSHT